MKLLVFTQKVDKDDSYFGFFHSWLQQFAEECEQVTVITLELHAYDLPSNVRVLSLGKENGRSVIKYLTRFWSYAWKYRKDYDVAFCHMSPLYVIAGFPIWKVLHKKIALWYIHRNVDLKLRIAEKLSDVIFTASAESFRIQSTKVHYMRQAVDVGQFKKPEGFEKTNDGVFRVVSVGRLTPIKNLDVLIQAAQELRSDGVPIEVTLVGAAVTERDQAYEAALHTQVLELKAESYVHFAGSMPFVNIREAYWNSDASVNLAPTGGMDKAVLESLAAGTPVFVSNEAFRETLSPYEKELMFAECDAKDLKEKLAAFYKRGDRKVLAEALQKRIEQEYSLKALIHSVVSQL